MPALSESCLPPLDPCTTHVTNPLSQSKPVYALSQPSIPKQNLRSAGAANAQRPGRNGAVRIDPEVGVHESGGVEHCCTTEDSSGRRLLRCRVRLSPKSGYGESRHNMTQVKRAADTADTEEMGHKADLPRCSQCLLRDSHQVRVATMRERPPITSVVMTSLERIVMLGA